MESVSENLFITLLIHRHEITELIISLLKTNNLLT